MSLGTRIREARQAAGMTQEQLARAISVTTATPSRWESDRNRPYPRLLEAIARELGTTVEALTQDDPKDDAEAALARHAGNLASALMAALGMAVGARYDRRRVQAPISEDRRCGDRRAVCA